MANKVLAGISLGLCMIAVGMSWGSIFYPNWYNWEIGPDESYEFGLLKMTDEDNVDGEPDSTGTTGLWGAAQWCGFHDEFDDVNTYESLCDTAKQSVGAALTYYILLNFANVIQVAYMITQVAILLDRDPGHKFAMMGKAVMFTILGAAAFGSWWGITGARYDNDCEWEDVQDDLNDGDIYEQCAGPGATFSIIAFGFMLTAGTFAMVNSLIQEDSVEVGYSNDTPMCCAPKIHFAIMMFFLMAVIGVSIGLWFVHWVHFEIDQGGIDDDWDGRLFYVEDFDLTPEVNLDLFGWDCLSVDPCDVDDDSTNCKTFDPMYIAGESYLHLEVTSLFFVLLLATFLGHALISSREWAHPVVVYGLAHLQWIFQLAAIAGWSSLSEVKFEMDDCSNDDVDSDEAYDICIRAGPVVSIMQLLIQVVVGCYFSVIYYNRGTMEAEVIPQSQPTEESQNEQSPTVDKGNSTALEGVTSKR